VGINPTRTGVIEILRRMGADIVVRNARRAGGEPVADLQVRAAPLRGIEVPPELVALAIDEFPALFVAAACAEGRTVVTGAAELRVKESDRIAVMAEGLRALGVQATPTPDGMVIVGRGSEAGVFASGEIEAHADHRIAMSFAMAGLRARGVLTVRDTLNVGTSFPGFETLARAAGLRIEGSE
jgi:3-phosphoshikimate 1-carboxyvinyltransferase